MTRTDALGRRLLTAGLERLHGGTLTLVEDGVARRFGDGLTDPAGRAPVSATVTIHDSRIWGRVLRETSTGLGLGYADGWWDADDLTAFLRLLSRNVRRTDALLQPLSRVTAKLADPVRRRRSPDRVRDRRNIRAHYDIGDEVFALFLDETRTYSCAIFERPETTLAQAQQAKLDRICDQLQLGPNDHLLEIGTGWGG
ncbi:MAG: SAM-dependent methyltransferase, partial [Actinobacteria bacterium]|nr:SAM-dependent methyltransferase [Actinomycetota bacterium]